MILLDFGAPAKETSQLSECWRVCVFIWRAEQMDAQNLIRSPWILPVARIKEKAAVAFSLHGGTRQLQNIPPVATALTEQVRQTCLRFSRRSCRSELHCSYPNADKLVRIMPVVNFLPSPKCPRAAAFPGRENASAPSPLWLLFFPPFSS